MDWFWRNPVADMPGPRFLLVYAVLIVLSMLAGWIVLRRRDDTEGEAIPPVPRIPDQYEIALLRGGPHEVARTVIFELISLGCARRLSRSDKLTNDPVKEGARLTPLQRVAHDWLDQSRSVADVFQPSGLSGKIERRMLPVQERFEEDRLLRPFESVVIDRMVQVAVAVAIGSFGGYKLLIALEKGKHNVFLLIGMMLVGLLLPVVLLKPRRLTRRGAAFLESMRIAFRRLTEKSAGPRGEPSGSAALPVGLTVALFGIGAVEGAVFADYRKLFQKASSTGSGSGSCSGSGGCGGGCGGGGCGGGCGGCGGG